MAEFNVKLDVLPGDTLVYRAGHKLSDHEVKKIVQVLQGMLPAGVNGLITDETDAELKVIHMDEETFKKKIIEIIRGEIPG